MHLHQFARVAAAAAILALPTAALAAPVQIAQNGPYYNGQYNGPWNDGRDRRGGELDGTVSSFQPYNLFLANGTHVALHNGTVINPTGRQLRGGQQVRVSGFWRRDGSFEANEIDIVGHRDWR